MAYSLPTLWSVIVINSDQPSASRISQYLERSKATPIDIYATALPGSSDGPLERAWSPLQEASARWRTLSLTLPLHSLPEDGTISLPPSLPNLVEALINTTTIRFKIRPTIHAPRLRRYSSVSDTIFPFYMDVELDYLCVARPTWRMLPHLHQFDAVTTLHFSTPDWMRQNGWRKVALPRLKRLMVTGGSRESVEDIVSRFFIAEALESLDLELGYVITNPRRNTSDPWFPSPFDFPSLSGIRYVASTSLSDHGRNTIGPEYLQALLQALNRRKNVEVELSATWVKVRRDASRADFQKLDEVVRWIEGNTAEVIWVNSEPGDPAYFTTWMDAREHFRG